MKCKQCGKEYAESDFFIDGQRRDVCVDCYGKHLDQHESVDDLDVNEDERQYYDDDLNTGYRARTLKFVGSFCSATGWLFVFLGVIGAVLSFSQMRIPMYFYPILGGSVLAIIMGTITVASGQVISCFVQIERNTRALAERLVE